MKAANIFITLLFVGLLLLCCTSLQQKLTEEQFYGQKPPGNTPEIYNPDFDFLNGANPDLMTISPDGMEICFAVEDTSATERYDRFTIYYTKREKGKWQKPEIAYFVANQGKGNLAQFSPDGCQFSYTFKGDLWTSTKKADLWSVAEKYPEPINSEKYECGFSLVKGDKFYFAANGRPEGKSNQCDIYCAKMRNGTAGAAQNLASLNTERSECVLAATPDEKYLVFTRYFNKSGNNAVDLFISFQKDDSTWTLARRLDTPYNSDGSNHSPRFSPDGKYFFFSQTNLTDTNDSATKHYWISTVPFDEMRKSVLANAKVND